MQLRVLRSSVLTSSTSLRSGVCHRVFMQNMQNPRRHLRIEPDAGKLKASPRLTSGSAAEQLTSQKNKLRSFPQRFIRNISVVAHVDHGKTTLTDALLRRAGLLPPDGVTGTFTDRLAIERARGITIKAQTCSVFLRHAGTGEEYLLNMIDTPGHVDFQYEVARSLRASEGVALLVDVRQGVEAQTMAQYYAALEHELPIVPVLTKLDSVLHEEEVRQTLQQLEDSTGLLRREVVLTSAKHKAGMEALFMAIIERVPPPHGREGFSDLQQLPVMCPGSAERQAAEDHLVPLRALLFDCWTADTGGMPAGRGSRSSLTALDDGIICLVRVMDGTVTPGTTVTFFHSRQQHEVTGTGIIHAELLPTAALTAGMVGYLHFRGLRKSDVCMGDTLCTVPSKSFTLAPRVTPTADATSAAASSSPPAGAAGGRQQVHAIPGFRQVQPVVFAGFYPDEGEYITQLRETVDTLCINDPSVTVTPLHCQALGPGLQLGFLGLLHMQVFKERLMMELGLSVLVTPPQVQYLCVHHGDNPDDPSCWQRLTVASWRWPHEGVGTYLEPVVRATVVTPKAYFNAINQAALTDFRGEQEDVRVVDDARVAVRYHMPLADLARGFVVTVKSSSHGYATLDYSDVVYTAADLVKLDIIINKAVISALSLICPRHAAAREGRRILAVLKAHLQRSSVDLPLQALLGAKVIARETIKAHRKDVTAKIHAGDPSRKRKKWDDQKKGKERMARRSVGTVTLDQNVLAAAMGAVTVK